MKKIIIFVFLILILVAVGFFIFKLKNKSPQNTPTPFLTPTGENSNNCTKDQLEATINSEGAAGSIYAKLVITNKSNTECTIMLGNYITASFEANNISTNYMDIGSINQSYSLTPGKSVYSQVHYPNGPQCSEIESKFIGFMYSTTDFSLDFVTDNKNSIQIQSCKSDEEETIIEIWPVSEKEINV